MSLRTPLSLLVLAAIVAAAGWYGWTKLQEPFENPFAGGREDCVRRTIEKGGTLRPEQVVVNVYNAGTRDNLASTTLEQLVDEGFLRGVSSNAPRRVEVATIAISDPDPASAVVRLVQAQFLGSVPVQRRPDLGVPGVDVVVGNDYRGLTRTARRTVPVRSDLTICLPRAPGPDDG